MSRSIHVIVRGDVQGVGYRAFAQSAARALRLTGWVRNLRDGGVEAVAEGEESALLAWATRLRQGPPAARIDEILTIREESRGCQTFEVKPTASVAEPFQPSGKRSA
jgi:acylphosphatase